MYSGEELRYAEKVVVLTGGTSGIGKGCVRVFGMWAYNFYSRQQREYARNLLQCTKVIDKYLHNTKNIEQCGDCC